MFNLCNGEKFDNLALLVRPQNFLDVYCFFGEVSFSAIDPTVPDLFFGQRKWPEHGHETHCNLIGTRETVG